MGLVAPRHVGSSRTRAGIRVPGIGSWILNHCATREARNIYFYLLYYATAYLFFLVSAFVAYISEMILL